jgi:putative hydrolase of the HAD superfamily
MVDVDGVLIDGRPEDGMPWKTSIEQDLGFTADMLHQEFFGPHWDDILLGRAGLMEHLKPALQKIAPHLTPDAFLSYWFNKDSRIFAPLLPELSLARGAGIRVYLATNQEHLRAEHLMGRQLLAESVDGIFYSARLGAKKPDPEFFIRVQAAVGLSGDEILLIDDSLKNVEAAATVGWQTIHWRTDTSPEVVRGFCG